MTAIVDTAVSPLLDARTTLAAAIEAATGYQCHASYEPSLTTPCYVLTGNGLVSTTSGIVVYRVMVTALYANQAGDLADGVEELARLALAACVDAGARWIDVDPPGSVTVGNNEFAGVQFEVTLPVTLRSI